MHKTTHYPRIYISLLKLLCGRSIQNVNELCECLEVMSSLCLGYDVFV